MQHSIIAEGFGIRLRPAKLEDAEFIVWLRNQDYVKGHVGDSAKDIVAQEDWLRSYFGRPGDYYFIAETVSEIPLGTYGIYDIEEEEAESGRWIMRSGVPAAIPSILLGFEVAFGTLGLRRLRAHTVATNHRVLSLNRKLGFKETNAQPDPQVINGKSAQLHQFMLEAGAWQKLRSEIVPLGKAAEDNIRNWEKSFTSHPVAHS